MKKTFYKLHRMAWTAFPISGVLLLMSKLLFGSFPLFLILLFFASVGLLAVVLLAAITMHISRRRQEGTLTKLLLQSFLVGVMGFLILTALDLTQQRIAWRENIITALVIGAVSLYAPPPAQRQ